MKAAGERSAAPKTPSSALDHPYICTIHELGEHHGQPLLVMERLAGRTLEERLEAKPIGSERVIEIGLQIADALFTAPGKGIVHRDLEPANLFVPERGDVKILDFGRAKLRPGRPRLRLSRCRRRLILDPKWPPPGALSSREPQSSGGRCWSRRSDSAPPDCHRIGCRPTAG